MKALSNGNFGSEDLIYSPEPVKLNGRTLNKEQLFSVQSKLNNYEKNLISNITKMVTASFRLHLSLPLSDDINLPHFERLSSCVKALSLFGLKVDIKERFKSALEHDLSSLVTLILFHNKVPEDEEPTSQEEMPLPEVSRNFLEQFDQKWSSTLPGNVMSRMLMEIDSTIGVTKREEIESNLREQIDGVKNIAFGLIIANEVAKLQKCLVDRISKYQESVGIEKNKLSIFVLKKIGLFINPHTEKLVDLTSFENLMKEFKESLLQEEYRLEILPEQKAAPVGTLPPKN